MRRAHPLPFGAEPLDGGGTRFRLWAPAAAAVAVRLEAGAGGRGRDVPMEPLGAGWFEAMVSEAGPGTRYRYALPGGMAVPDPASRFQPEDVHGPSEVVDAKAFLWRDADWRGRPWEQAVLYELHVGSFTSEGTFAAVERRLDHLVDLGITALELMPVAEAPGGHNWGYDGVLPFAPEARYGRPEDLKALVQAAHARGLMVFLDVVYNHFGPEGNYLHLYAPGFFTERYHTPWGRAIAFDGPERAAVRAFFVHNALYWLAEYHFDGLRLDAVHAIFDSSEPDILEEIAAAVRAGPGRKRHVHLVLENDDNAARYLARDGSGAPCHYVAQWNDDIHHVLHALVTGESGGYYGDYADAPARHLGRALAEGFVYQGERSPYRGGAPRGEPSAQLPPSAFVAFLQNHDQVGNRAFGERISALAGPEAVRAAVAVVLLAPSPPLLFMGEEWAAAQPFPFFCDFGDDLADAVREGRRREFARFPEFRDAEARARIPDPNSAATFASAVLDWAEIAAAPHRDWLAFYRDLLRRRHAEIVPRLAGMAGHAGVYEVLGAHALTVRWRLGDGALLRLFANLGDREAPVAAPEAPGRLLFASQSDARGRLSAGRLPPWSAMWFLADDAPSGGA